MRCALRFEGEILYGYGCKANWKFSSGKRRVCAGIVCICIAGIIWFGRSTTLIAPAIICAILTACFLSSLIVESRTQAGRIGGVITIKEVIARQGDGQNYSPSFKDQLHEGTEFNLPESRPGWLHIKLFDDSDGWIPETAADLI